MFIPSDKDGILTKMSGEDFERLPTYYAHALSARIGGRVRKSRDLASFCAHLWLTGEPEDVERDAKKARNEFKVEVDPLPEEETEQKAAQTTPITIPVVIPDVPIAGAMPC